MWSNFKSKFIGDRQFYFYVLHLAIPMIVQNAITSFVSFLDNIMVGQIGTEQMTGVAIVNQLIFVFNICIFGSVSGAGIFGTQFYGKGDYEGQKYAFRFKMYTSVGITLIALALFGTVGTQLISLYLSDSGSIGDIGLALHYGEQYLMVMMLTLPPFAIGQTYTSSVRETGQTLVSMVASMAAVVANLVLDYCLIFGIGGIPAMGVVGAAIATAIARLLECAIVVGWTHLHPSANPYIVGAYRSFRIPKKIFKSILIKGTPLMLNEMFWAAGMAVIAQCYAVRGLEVVAANNIASTITNLFNIVYLQLGACISIVVGQLLGAGKIEKARDSAIKMIFFCVASCSALAVLMIGVGRFFPEIYNTEREIKDLAKRFIAIAALAMPMYAYCHGAYFTLRSGGRTGITFLFDSVYTWVVIIPIAFGLAHYSGFSITTVFFLVQFTEIFKVILGFFMIRSGVWLQNIVNE